MKHDAARIGWVDAARGLGILLVVAGHALGGLIDSPIGAGQGGFRLAFFAIYAFHMPLFFLLSGLMVAPRLAKGERRFFGTLLPTLVWPYFLWSAIQFSVIFALGTLVNHPISNYWPVILGLPFSTVSQFWFLHALLLLHMLAMLIVPRLGSQAFLLIAIALKSVVLLVVMPVAIKSVCTHALFYALGVHLGVGGIDQLVVRHRAAVKALILPAIAIALMLITINAAPLFGSDVDLAHDQTSAIGNLAWRFPVLATAMFAVAACLGVASLARVAALRWLTTLGQLTMPIFVLHILFIAGTRIVATKTGLISDPFGLLVVTMLAGLAGPLLAERVTRALHLNRWIGFGKT